ncbi:carboxylesterase family protein [Ilyonectria robusta]
MTNFVQQSVAAGKPVIGITLNYRLSAFGFLWGSAELNATGSANNGLRDQRLALHWIQENINAFGGDPTKVTIFGQSAGGLSAGKQLIAYGGRDDGLFRGAILQSGGMAEKWPYNIDAPISYTTDLYQNLTITTGCAGQTSELECLRSLPLEELSKALNVSRTPVFSGTGLGPWLTVVDGDFLQDGPTESLIKGHFNKVPIIYTTTTDEATVFGFSGPVNTNEEFRRFVAAGGPDEDTVAMIETLYPNVDALGLPAGYSPPENDTLGLQYKRVVAYHTDAVETSSRRLTVDTWAASGETAYSGRVNILIPGSAAFLGCPHATEVDFVFDVIDNGNKAMKEMAKLMSRTWASFVHDLDPNNHGRECIQPTFLGEAC